jgi:hypothetical protein
VILRFLENRAFAEVGAALRVSEDAARMRAERALDKLRSVLGRRGITSTAAALGAIVSSQAMVSAPAALAASLAPEAMAAAGLAGVAFSTLMTTKIIAITAATALAAFGAGAYVGLSRSFDATPPPPIETPLQSRTIASLRHDNVELKAEVDRLSAEASRRTEAIARLGAQHAAPQAPKGAALGVTHGQQQQAMLNYLRQIFAARDQFQLENNRPPTSIQELVGADKYIREIIPLDGEDYSSVNLQPGQLLTVTSASGVTVTYDPAGTNTTVPDFTPAELHAQELSRKVQASGNNAVAAYRAANNGNNPPNSEALIPYFATPQEGADFVEFLEAQKAAQSH